MKIENYVEELKNCITKEDIEKFLVKYEPKIELNAKLNGKMINMREFLTFVLNNCKKDCASRIKEKIYRKWNNPGNLAGKFFEDIFGKEFEDLRNKDIKEEIKKGIIEILKFSDFLMKLKKNDNLIIEGLNKLSEDELKKIKIFYQTRKKEKINEFRYEILNLLLEGQNLTSEIIENLKSEVDKKYGTNIFRSWKYFSIFYPFFYIPKKDYFSKVLNLLVETIRDNLSYENLKIKIQDFNGSQNFGDVGCWIAFYNGCHKSQKDATQLVIDLYKTNFGLNVYNFSKDISYKSKKLNESDFSLEEIIVFFNENLKFLKKDNCMSMKNLEILQENHQIILQGPPGTGKTRLAKILAVKLIKGNDVLSVESNEENIKNEFKKIKDNAKIIQFHPSYSYEDFVRGIIAKTTSNGISYEVEDKILTKMAKKALENPEEKFVLIIDEINRANLSAVLGELIYALEYRGEAVESMYELNENREIILPENLYIIGTMNTADRSVGHIDYAIRRRFTFINILPDRKIIEEHKAQDLFDKIEKIFDYYLSPEFDKNDVMIGHSYFLSDNLKNSLEYKIKPLLLEYVKDGVLKENAKKEIKNLSVQNA